MDRESLFGKPSVGRRRSVVGRRITSVIELASAVVLVAMVTGCGGGDATISGRAENPCLQTIPACPGVFAQCVIDPNSYARVRFPGSMRFLAEVDAGFTLEVHLLFAEQREPGEDTKIYFHEPGCTDLQLYESLGDNLFFESEDTGVFTESVVVEKDGEHLIEILTDMQAEALITVDFIPPQ